MRWALIVLLMCNGIFFLWQNYLLQNEIVAPPGNTGQVEGNEVSLQLLSEREGIKSPAVAVEPKSMDTGVAISEVDSVSSSVCWLIGPFQEEVSSKQMLNRLAALDISVHVQSVEISGKPNYWVYLPPQLSRKAAVKLLRELQAKKIDSFLITEGELADGISLGFFTAQERADRVLEQRIKEGYAAEIKIVPRVRSEIWVIFDRGEYTKLSDVLWDKIKQGNKGIERRKNYCDKIASANNFD